MKVFVITEAENKIVGVVQDGDKLPERIVTALESHFDATVTPLGDFDYNDLQESWVAFDGISMTCSVDVEDGYTENIVITATELY